MRQVLIAGGLLAALGCAVLAPVSEAASKRGPSKQQIAVIEHRQGQMKQLRAAMKTLGGFAQGSGDVGQARSAAAVMSRAGAAMPHLWPVGTGVGVGESSSRNTVWKERPAFAARVAQFQTAVAGLNAAVATGDRAQVGQRLGAVGGACKACHDGFQVKD